MFKILILSLFALCHCQQVIEVGDGDDVQQALPISSGNTVSSVSVGNRVVSPGVQLVNPVGFSGLSSIAQFQRPAAFDYAFQHLSHPVASGVNVVSGVQPAGVVGIGGLSGLTGLSGLRGLGGVVSGVNPQIVYAAIPISSVQSVQPSIHTGLHHYANNVGVISAAQAGVIPAAIQSAGRTVEFRAVPFNDEQIVPTVVEVEPSEIPLNIHFKSKSSTIQVSQSHQPGEPGTVETTQSQDEPSRVIHEVVKPVVQEVREVVQPFRQVTQEVQPVVEQVHTVVSRGEGVRQQYIAQPHVGLQNLNALRVAQPVFGVQHQQPVFAYQQAYQQPIFGQGVRFAVQQQPAYQVAYGVQPSYVGGVRIVSSQQQPQVFSVGGLQGLQGLAGLRGLGPQVVSVGQTPIRVVNGGSVVGQQQPIAASQSRSALTKSIQGRGFRVVDNNGNDN